MEEFGFIMTRHVNSYKSNRLWNHSYNCIRRFYPENIIIIIDDSSNYEYVKEYQPLYKTTIINSAYQRRGELLPYIFYLNTKFFDKAVIIHDSVFINSLIDTDIEDYKILWDFEHDWDQIEDERKMISLFNDKILSDFYENKKLWKGCFGAMCIITHDYLKKINIKYDMAKLLGSVLTRYNRCSFERVIACLLQLNKINKSMFGDIHLYGKHGVSFDEKDINLHLPIIKVWSGR